MVDWLWIGSDVRVSFLRGPRVVVTVWFQGQFLPCQASRFRRHFLLRPVGISDRIPLSFGISDM